MIPGRGELAAAPPGSRLVPPPDAPPEVAGRAPRRRTAPPAAPPVPADAGKAADAAEAGKAGDEAADGAGGGGKAGATAAGGDGRRQSGRRCRRRQGGRADGGQGGDGRRRARSGRPDGPVPLRPAEGGPDAPADPPPRAAAAAAPDPPPAQSASPSAPVDPPQFGAEGTGGPPSPEALALLKNKNVVLDADGVSDLKQGRVDPRIVGVLTKLSGEHKITISVHQQGPLEVHRRRLGLQPLRRPRARHRGHRRSDRRPGQPAGARGGVASCPELDPSIRPTEIGSPFAISGPGYFTDAAHQNHIHVGFDGQVPADFKPPAGLSAAAPDAAPPDPVAAGAPAAAGARRAGRGGRGRPGPRRASGLFAAIEERRDVRAASDKRAGDSGIFASVDEPAAARLAAAGATPADAAPDLTGAPTDYPGDDAPREQIAAWMAAEAKRRGIPPQLPVMAALVESNLKNLNFGDADSVGFFQMRLSIWNQGEYAGYPDDPEKQIDWFLDHAAAGQDAAPRRRRVGHGPEPVRRLDRRRRAARRAVPRPLPAPPRRGQPAARRRRRRPRPRPRPPAAGTRAGRPRRTRPRAAARLRPRLPGGGGSVEAATQGAAGQQERRPAGRRALRPAERDRRPARSWRS